MDRDEAMSAALRVLTAICDRTAPDAGDVEQLKTAAPKFAALPPDELACAVIDSTIKARKKKYLVRAAG